MVKTKTKGGGKWIKLKLDDLLPSSEKRII